MSLALEKVIGVNISPRMKKARRATMSVQPQNDEISVEIAPNQTGAIVSHHKMLSGYTSRTSANKHGLAGLSVGAPNGQLLMSEIPFTHNQVIKSRFMKA